MSDEAPRDPVDGRADNGLSPEVRRLSGAAEMTVDLGEDDLEAYPLPGEERLASVATEAAMEESSAAALDMVPVATEVAPAPVLVPEVMPSVSAPVPQDDATDVMSSWLSSLFGGGGGDEPPDGGSGGASGDDGGKHGFWAVVDKPMTIYEHLDELRRRLMWSAIAFIIATSGVFLVVRRLVNYMELAYHVHLQAIKPMEAIFASMRLAALGGLIVASPFLLYQLIAYVLPAMTRRERKMLASYLPATLLLFVMGASFGLFVFQPIAFRMSQAFLPSVTTTPTVTYWIDFMLNYSMPFGLFFEMPVVVVILAKLGMLRSETLARGRRVGYFGAFVLGMAFAPPADFIVTPTLIAGPVIVLYEVSIWLAKAAERQLWRDEG